MKCGTTDNDGVFVASIGGDSIRAGSTDSFGQKLVEVMNTQPSKDCIFA